MLVVLMGMVIRSDRKSWSERIALVKLNANAAAPHRIFRHFLQG